MTTPSALTQRSGGGEMETIGMTPFGMAPSPSVLLDASGASWAEFVSGLEDALQGAARRGSFAYVRPPARCADEAGRLVRALGYEDRVQILGLDEGIMDMPRTTVSGTARRIATDRGTAAERLPKQDEPRWRFSWREALATFR